MAKKTIIVTAGPTNERIDAVMKITNMSTGTLSMIIAEKLLDRYDEIRKIYYISPKLARKPRPYGDRLKCIQIESAEELKATLEKLLSNPDEHIDAVVHACAVGDYKGRYAARAEDIAHEIASLQAKFGAPLTEGSILEILKNPRCLQDDNTKISSYEPNLMVMLDLTPKVIGCIKEVSPDTMLIGCKLLEGVSEEELFDVASHLRQKNKADYIIANDLSKIRSGVHPAMIIGKAGVNDDGTDKDDVLVRCTTKNEIAAAVESLILKNPS